MRSLTYVRDFASLSLITYIMKTQTRISPKWILIAVLLTCSAFLSEVRAHGVQIETSVQAPYVSIHAYFSRTSPIKDALITIQAPGDDKPWQTGRTDMAGNFAFMPNKPGAWVVAIDDERGHKGSTSVVIAEGFFSRSGTFSSSADGSVVTEHFLVESNHTLAAEKPVMEKEVIVESTTTKNIPLVYRAIFGLSLIFGITGITYGMMMHRKFRLSGK